jgi:hypothetical protein
MMGPAINQRTSPNKQRRSPYTSPPKIFKNELLTFLPFHANSLTEFYNTIKTKIGLLFIYSEKDIELLHHLVENLFMEPEVLHILEYQFITFSLITESTEAQGLLRQAKINNNNTPCCLFMYNPHNLNTKDSNIIIDKLEGVDNLDKLHDSIYKNLSNKDNIDSNKNLKNTDYTDYMDYEDDDSVDSNAKIIKAQQEEMRRLEREEDDKKRRIKFEEELRKQKEKEEHDLFLKRQEEEKRIHNMKLYMRKQLPVEPPTTEPSATHILFRFPDGINRAERRFFKQDKIQDLYNYIISLDDASFNNHEGKFDLIQTFPFVAFTEKDRTLEEEKLFPNAVIQIREKEV